MAQIQTAARELSATEARGGARGPDVFWVLVISLVLAIVALIATWIYWSPRLSASAVNDGQRPAVARDFNTSPTQPLRTP